MIKVLKFISRIFRCKNSSKKSQASRDIRYANKLFAAIVPLAEEYMKATGEKKITIASGQLSFHN